MLAAGSILADEFFAIPRSVDSPRCTANSSNDESTTFATERTLMTTTLSSNVIDTIARRPSVGLLAFLAQSRSAVFPSERRAKVLRVASPCSIELADDSTSDYEAPDDSDSNYEPADDNTSDHEPPDDSDSNYEPADYSTSSEQDAHEDFDREPAAKRTRAFMSSLDKRPPVRTCEQYFPIDDLLSMRTPFPYRDVGKEAAVHDFLRLRDRGESAAPRSRLGLIAVDFGTERQRFETIAHGKISQRAAWEDRKHRTRIVELARGLARKARASQDNNTLLRQAMCFRFGSVCVMRPKYALDMYKSKSAKCVLDPTAGWGARMIAAMAGNFHYIGIDSNKKLEDGYKRIEKALAVHSQSRINMIFDKAENVDFSSLGEYNMIFTSPPYEAKGGVVELYQGMSAYTDFYEQFFFPVILGAYDSMQSDGWMVLNMPDHMYVKLKEVFRPYDELQQYPMHRWKNRQSLSYEPVFCWHKMQGEPCALRSS